VWHRETRKSQLLSVYLPTKRSHDCTDTNQNCFLNIVDSCEAPSHAFGGFQSQEMALCMEYCHEVWCAIIHGTTNKRPSDTKRQYWGMAALVFTFLCVCDEYPCGENVVFIETSSNKMKLAASSTSLSTANFVVTISRATALWGYGSTSQVILLNICRGLYMAWYDFNGSEVHQRGHPMQIFFTAKTHTKGRNVNECVTRMRP